MVFTDRLSDRDCRFTVFFPENSEYSTSGSTDPKLLYSLLAPASEHVVHATGTTAVGAGLHLIAKAIWPGQLLKVQIYLILSAAITISSKSASAPNLFLVARNLFIFSKNNRLMRFLAKKV